MVGNRSVSINDEPVLYGICNNKDTVSVIKNEIEDFTVNDGHDGIRSEEEEEAVELAVKNWSGVSSASSFAHRIGVSPKRVSNALDNY